MRYEGIIRMTKCVSSGTGKLGSKFAMNSFANFVTCSTAAVCGELIINEMMMSLSFLPVVLSVGNYCIEDGQMARRLFRDNHMFPPPTTSVRRHF